jgi:hypothetical protein
MLEIKLLTVSAFSAMTSGRGLCSDKGMMIALDAEEEDVERIVEVAG